MIKHVTGDILDSSADALVNAVNTVGVMGKVIALQFRQAFPDNYDAYVRACEDGKVQPGHMFVFHRLTHPRWIINFPAKRHWRRRARMADVTSALIETVKHEVIKSIAVPPLGCGNGGLDWKQVRPRLESAFKSLADVAVFLYEPKGAPAADEMNIATSRPRMTAGRAALISLIDHYALPWYRVTLLQIQKLAYFIEAVGEPLNLDFVTGKYGPYAKNLHRVLHRRTLHTRLWRSQPRCFDSAPPGAREEATGFLASDSDTQSRLERVSALIEGFETPHSMELLATVRWLANEDPAARTDPNAAVAGIQAWNEHKKLAFSAEHVRTAWQRLKEKGWI